MGPGAVAALWVMATALVAMAAVQIAAALEARRASRAAVEAVQALRRDLAPVIARVQQVADDAARVAALAVTQLERVDRFLATVTGRVEETLAVVQRAIAGPARQGVAFLTALRAVLTIFRTVRGEPSRREEEDALFIG